MTPFPHLFDPIRVGSKTLRHRLNFGAHTANMSAEGLPAERHLAKLQAIGRLDTPVETEEIEDCDPDVVVLAAGS